MTSAIHSFIKTEAIEQGSIFRRILSYEDPNANPVELTGCKARMHIRETIGSAVVLVELTTENGGITLGGAAGTITLFISAVETATFTWTKGVYDLELIPAGDEDEAFRLISGKVSVTPEVTRG